MVSPIVVRRSPRSVASRPVDSVARVVGSAVMAWLVAAVVPVIVSVSAGIDTETGAGGGVGRVAAGAVLAAAGDAFEVAAFADRPFAAGAAHGGASARAPRLPASWTDSAARGCRATPGRACDRLAAGRRDRRRAPPWPPATARCRRTRWRRGAGRWPRRRRSTRLQLRARRRPRTVEPQRLDARQQPLVVAPRRCLDSVGGARHGEGDGSGAGGAANGREEEWAGHGQPRYTRIDAGFRAWPPGCPSGCPPRRNTWPAPARRGPCRRRRSRPGRPPPSCRPAARRG